MAPHWRTLFVRCPAGEQLTGRFTAVEHGNSKNTPSVRSNTSYYTAGFRLILPGVPFSNSTLVETKSKRLRESSRAEIRVRLRAQLARLSRTALPETGQNLDLAETSAQTPHRETGSRRAQIGIEVGEAHEPRALGRKA